MAIAIELLAIRDVDTRKRSLHLPAFARDPVNLVALHLIGGGGLDRMIVESDQIVTLPRVVARRRLWLHRRLLWRRSLLPLTVSVVLRVVLRDVRWRRGIRASAVGVRIVAVVIRIVSVIRVTGIIIGIIGVPPAAKSKVEARAPVTASIETAASVISSASEATTAVISASSVATAAGESAPDSAATSVRTSSSTTPTVATATLGISRSKQKR